MQIPQVVWPVGKISPEFSTAISATAQSLRAVYSPSLGWGQEIQIMVRHDECDASETRTRLSTFSSERSKYNEEIAILSVENAEKLVRVLELTPQAEVAAAALLQLFTGVRRSELPYLGPHLFLGRRGNLAFGDAGIDGIA